jgi:tetratricopeptide (TPR) repeat protein
MTRRVSVLLLIIAFLVLAGSALRATTHSSANSRKQLRQYVAQLQNHPDNLELRKKIIKLALTMRPAPSVSQTALEAEGAAEYAFQAASSKDDYDAAAKLYEKALLAAPWSAEYYLNLAVCREKAEEYDKAITNYNFYILAAPDAKDRDDVLKKIGAMKYAAEQNSPQAVAERNAREAQAQAEKQRREAQAQAEKQRLEAQAQAEKVPQEEADFIKNLDARYSCANGIWPNGDHAPNWVVISLYIHGGQAIWGRWINWHPTWDEMGRAQVSGRQFDLPFKFPWPDNKGFTNDSLHVSISRDGSHLIGTTKWCPEAYILKKQLLSNIDQSSHIDEGFSVCPCWGD